MGKAALLLVLICGCATLSPREPLPSGKACVYIPIFVDEVDGTISPVLTEFVRRELYARLPEVYAAEFRDDCLAVDGAVLSLDDDQRGDEQILTLRVSASLVEKFAPARDLGSFVAKARYKSDTELAGNEFARYRALAEASQKLSRQLIEKILEAA